MAYHQNLTVLLLFLLLLKTAEDIHVVLQKAVLEFFSLKTDNKAVGALPPDGIKANNVRVMAAVIAPHFKKKPVQK